MNRKGIAKKRSRTSCMMCTTLSTEGGSMLTPRNDLKGQQAFINLPTHDAPGHRLGFFWA